MAGEITRLLVQARSGDAQQLSAVFEVLYPQLRDLASRRLRTGGNTLTPTELVHESYLRLTGGECLSAVDRRHFFALAARAMRSILVDRARRRQADKRGGGRLAVTLREDIPDAHEETADVLALHDGLEALESISPRRREIVELRYFTGLGHAEIAELLDCSERTVKNEWGRARAFLHAVLAP